MDLETNVIVEFIHVEFIDNKFTSDSNVQEPDLTMTTLNSTLSEKNINPKVTSLSEPRKSQRFRKEKQLDIYFISNDVTVF